MPKDEEPDDRERDGVDSDPREWRVNQGGK